MNAHCITGNFVQIIFEICTVDYVKTLKKNFKKYFSYFRHASENN